MKKTVLGFSLDVEKLIHRI